MYQNNEHLNPLWGSEDPQRSGFEDDPDCEGECHNIDHSVPTMLYIPPGKRYRHVCPGCGKTTFIRGSSVYKRM